MTSFRALGTAEFNGGQWVFGTFPGSCASSMGTSPYSGRHVADCSCLYVPENANEAPDVDRVFVQLNTFDENDGNVMLRWADVAGQNPNCHREFDPVNNVTIGSVELGNVTIVGTFGAGLPIVGSDQVGLSCGTSSSSEPCTAPGAGAQCGFDSTGTFDFTTTDFVLPAYFWENGERAGAYAYEWIVAIRNPASFFDSVHTDPLLLQGMRLHEPELFIPAGTFSWLRGAPELEIRLSCTYQSTVSMETVTSALMYVSVTQPSPAVHPVGVAGNTDDGYLFGKWIRHPFVDSLRTGLLLNETVTARHGNVTFLEGVCCQCENSAPDSVCVSDSSTMNETALTSGNWTVRLEHTLSDVISIESNVTNIYTAELDAPIFDCWTLGPSDHLGELEDVGFVYGSSGGGPASFYVNPTMPISLREHLDADVCRDALPGEFQTAPDIRVHDAALIGVPSEHLGVPVDADHVSSTGPLDMVSAGTTKGRAITFPVGSLVPGTSYAVSVKPLVYPDGVAEQSDAIYNFQTLPPPVAGGTVQWRITTYDERHVWKLEGLLTGFSTLAVSGSIRTYLEVHVRDGIRGNTARHDFVVRSPSFVPAMTQNDGAPASIVLVRNDSPTTALFSSARTLNVTFVVEDAHGMRSLFPFSELDTLNETIVNSAEDVETLLDASPRVTVVSQGVTPICSCYVPTSGFICTDTQFNGACRLDPLELYATQLMSFGYVSDDGLDRIDYFARVLGFSHVSRNGSADVVVPPNISDWALEPEYGFLFGREFYVVELLNMLRQCLGDVGVALDANLYQGEALRVVLDAISVILEQGSVHIRDVDRLMALVVDIFETIYTFADARITDPPSREFREAFPELDGPPVQVVINDVARLLASANRLVKVAAARWVRVYPCGHPVKILLDNGPITIYMRSVVDTSEDVISLDNVDYFAAGIRLLPFASGFTNGYAGATVAENWNEADELQGALLNDNRLLENIVGTYGCLAEVGIVARFPTVHTTTPFYSFIGDSLLSLDSMLMGPSGQPITDLLPDASLNLLSTGFRLVSERTSQFNAATTHCVTYSEALGDWSESRCVTSEPTSENDRNGFSCRCDGDGAIALEVVHNSRGELERVSGLVKAYKASTPVTEMMLYIVFLNVFGLLLTCGSCLLHKGWAERSGNAMALERVAGQRRSPAMHRRATVTSPTVNSSLYGKGSAMGGATTVAGTGGLVIDSEGNNLMSLAPPSSRKSDSGSDEEHDDDFDDEDEDEDEYDDEEFED